MRLKLDENLGARCADLFQEAGHDTATVVGQRLTSAPDAALIEVCRKEDRCLISLDLDFGNPLLFDPAEYTGIAVLRLPAKPSHQDLVDAARTLIGALAQQEIRGKLWVIQRGRVRVYQPEN